MSRAAAVLFDIDGTLVDSVDFHAAAWGEAFACFGHRIARARIRAQIGKGGDELLPVFLSLSERRRHGTAIAELSGQIFVAKYRHRVRPFPRVRALFRKLRADGWKIGLASSADTDDLAHYVKLCGIGRLVDATTSADDADRSKPHADIFVAARNRLHRISPERCIVVGDSPYDAIGARRAKMRAVGFLSGGFGAARLTHAGCRWIYRGPADLLLRYEGSVFCAEAPGRNS